MERDEPDWEALRAIGREAMRLRDEGRWTRAEFERLLERARVAARGHSRLLQFLVTRAPPVDPPP